ncbi:hypothetical protein BOX15_Mlig022324g1 [Macrostomum lignano]|uniref:Rad60-SLD domain-containing protein n=2 Tax=Macrostomum lignano TaxID=282301 RepID=A0A1I8GFI7_9PLAT|nr:hypothetical protein BOX15_Mlig022324g1 [Macrostomum lignano]
MVSNNTSDEKVVEDPTMSSDEVPIGLDTNNSMPLADKAYDPPTLPEEINAYKFDLTDTIKHYRSTFRPTRRNYVTMFFRTRRRNYELLLWQLITSGVITKEKMYMPECLPYWTVGIKMRVRVNYPLGKVMDTMKERLGITSPGLRFCLDGFFGMVNYSDIFGNTADACPWMEISNNSTVESLRLADGDSIFISIASMGQIQNVAKWRKQRTITDASKQAAGVSPDAGMTRAEDETATEEIQTIG